MADSQIKTARKPFRILVVEDSEAQLEELRLLLEDGGFEVVTAAGGKEGLDAARKSDVSLVISDILMPGMDGYALCRAIKADAALRHLPVILITHLRDSRDVLAGIEAGATNFISKPVNGQHLLEHVRKVLSNPEGVVKGPDAPPVEVSYSGNCYRISASRAQILELLLSTHDDMVRQNNELSFARDEAHAVSELLKAEIVERKRQELATKKANERMEQLDHVKSDFVSIVSHELRTPLASIKNAVDLILKKKTGDLTAAQEKFLSMAERNVTRMQGLLSDLLDMAKIESGRMEWKYSDVEVKNLVQKTVEMLEFMAGSKAIALEADLDEGLPPISVDEERITQVLLNLVNNAIKFTNEGGWIKIKAGIVKDKAENPPDGAAEWLVIEVIDNGKGIPDDYQINLFEKFRQAEDSMSPKRIAGTGLGLAISKGIVEGHGGTIKCRSKVGEGTTFTVNLPVVNQEILCRRECADQIAGADGKMLLSMVLLSTNNFSGDIGESVKALIAGLMEECRQIVVERGLKTSDKVYAILPRGELAFILPHTDRTGAQGFKKRIFQLMGDKSIAVDGRVEAVKFVSGIATFPDDGVSGERLLEFAREQLERAKKEEQ